MCHSLKVLFAGGGTGGHIAPGLAVLDALKTLRPDVEAAWVGTPERREAEWIPREGVPFFPIALRGIQRGRSFQAILHNLRGLLEWVTTRPMRTASRHLKLLDPHVVVATGGYVCVPVSLSARLRGLPVIALEQNARVGTAVWLLSYLVQSVVLAYEGSESDLSDRSKHHVMGNPVRARVLSLTQAEGRQHFGLPPQGEVLLITGGSLGSRDLNKACVEALKRMEGDDVLKERLFVLFHTGEHHLSWVKEALRDSPFHIQFHPYIVPMPEALACSDLVIARGGAMTVAELSARGLPAILLPWVGAARDHQRINCETLASQGGAIMITADQLSGERLVQELYPLLLDSAARNRMAEISRRAGRPHAAMDVAALILDYAEKRNPSRSLSNHASSVD